MRKTEEILIKLSNKIYDRYKEDIEKIKFCSIDNNTVIRYFPIYHRNSLYKDIYEYNPDTRIETDGLIPMNDIESFFTKARNDNEFVLLEKISRKYIRYNKSISLCFDKSYLDYYREFINRNLIVHNNKHNIDYIMNDEDIVSYLNNPCRIISNTCNYPNERLKDLYKIVFCKQPKIKSVMYIHERTFIDELKDYPEV